MDFLKILKKYVIDSQLYVSVMGTMLASFFMLEQNTFQYPMALLAGITYFCGYQYTKYQHSRFFGKILLLLAVGAVVCVAGILRRYPAYFFYKWCCIVCAGIFYNSFFLKTYIRKIPFVKLFYIGLVWGLVNAWLCLPQFSSSVFASSFLFISALVLPFDIRDMHDDKILTFPKIIGVQNTRYLAYLLIFCAVMTAIPAFSTLFAAAFFLAAAVAFILIYFAEQSRNSLFFSFWIETCVGLPFLFLILLKYF